MGNRWPPASDEAWAKIVAGTHAFQNVRPYNPEVAAICARCRLALPQGPILSIGPGGLPPCNEPPTLQDNGR